MDPLEHEKAFNLLDAYVRTKHGCFLAEMFVSNDPSEYVLCFRPSDTSTTNQYACKYVRVSRTEMESLSTEKALGAGLSDTLDRELAPLSRSAQE